MPVVLKGSEADSVLRWICPELQGSALPAKQEQADCVVCTFILYTLIAGYVRDVLTSAARPKLLTAAADLHCKQHTTNHHL